MDASVLISVAICLLTILLLKRLFGDQKTPPGPWGLPVFGYIPFLSDKPHLKLQTLAKKYGGVFSVRLGSKYVVVLSDFQSTKEAYAQDAFMGRPEEIPIELHKETVDTGALLDLPWKEHRRLCLHLLRDLGLGKSKIEGHIQEEIMDLLEQFEKNTNKPYSIRGILAPSMSNNIASLVFGKRLKYEDPVRQMLSRAVNDIAIAGGQAAWTVFFPWLKKVFKFFGLADVDRVSRSSHELRNYAWKEIMEHEETLNPNSIRDFIDGYLIAIEKRKDDPTFIKPVLHDLVVGLFTAGSETVRHSVEWLILATAKYQDAQRRIQAEIGEAIGQNRLPTWPDHQSMPYTDAFIMEMMRWRTVLPLNVLRYTLMDTTVSGFFIPKHTTVLSNLWAIHHDKKFWGMDAEEFRPERFLTEDGKALKKMELYIPFSIGKRSCPGESLAKVETFLYFTSILQKFNVRLPDGKEANFEGELGISLAPKHQDIILTKRN